MGLIYNVRHEKKFHRFAVSATAVLFLGACVNTPKESVPDQIVDIASSVVLDGGSFSVDVYFKGKEHPLELFIPNSTRYMESFPTVQILNVDGSVKEKLLPTSSYARELHKAIATSLLDPQIDLKAKSELKVLDALLLGRFRSFDRVYFPERWKGIAE